MKFSPRCVPWRSGISISKGRLRLKRISSISSGYSLPRSWLYSGSNGNGNLRHRLRYCRGILRKCGSGRYQRTRYMPTLPSMPLPFFSSRAVKGSLKNMARSGIPGSFFGFEDTVIHHIWLSPKEAMMTLPIIGQMNGRI